jgi:hypothetical protein
MRRPEAERMGGAGFTGQFEQDEVVSSKFQVPSSRKFQIPTTTPVL